MKYVSNTTKNSITYKDKIIPPGASVMLNNKGEVIDEVTDNTEELEKLRGEISKAVTLAQVDSRLEEVEDRITNLVTCANSKKSIESFRTTDFTKLLEPSTLLSCAISNNERYYVTECIPVSEYLKGLEPGIYLGELSKKFTSELCGYVYIYEKGCTYSYACGCICLTARSCLVIPYTCSYGCVSGYQISTPGFIFQVSENDIKNAYVCNTIGFEKCNFCLCDGPVIYCVHDWDNNVHMSLKDYLSSNLPELYKKANETIITTSAIKLQ